MQIQIKKMTVKEQQQQQQKIRRINHCLLKKA